jgi:hypothetical protein
MLTKAEYMVRPEDINLGPVWNSMRVRQRELNWPTYWMNCQMAQSSNPLGFYGRYGSYTTLDSIFGPGLL